jgi:Polysaccharide deacetylase
MRLSRREFFLGAGGTAVGVAGVAAVGVGSDQMHKHVMFHEAYASAVRATQTSPPPTQPRSTIVWSGPTDGKRLALTFDDGPRPDWTPKVLEALARHDVRATFFVCGQGVRDYPADGVPQRQVARDLGIGSSTVARAVGVGPAAEVRAEGWSDVHAVRVAGAGAAGRVPGDAGHGDRRAGQLDWRIVTVFRARRLGAGPPRVTRP